jgi:Leucine-rich repeat (LRR) protein
MYCFKCQHLKKFGIDCWEDILLLCHQGLHHLDSIKLIFSDDTSLPNPLPPTLEYLICYNVLLPDNLDLPKGLKVLSCNGCVINKLPVLLKCLEDLECANNNLMCLPDLPESLVSLQCRKNQLTFLPKLPKGLIELDYSDNQIENIVILPDGLKFLNLDLHEAMQLDLPWSLECEIYKLAQYNKRLSDLGMKNVEEMPRKDDWDDINEKWLCWQYRIDGEEYNKVKRNIKIK